MIAKETIRSLVELEHTEGFFFVKELEQIFIEQTPRLLLHIRIGLEQDDTKAVFGGAHTLKSTCGYLGISEMTLACEKLENWTRNSERTLIEAEVYISSLEKSFRDAEVELHQIISEMTDTE
jgi:HPt (histidine-containing phosphotransfer) domain-containing protein